MFTPLTKKKREKQRLLEFIQVRAAKVSNKCTLYICALNNFSGAQSYMHMYLNVHACADLNTIEVQYMYCYMKTWLIVVVKCITA